MKLSQQQHLDVQAQAKILVTVAVVANLLLALVLSLIMLLRPAEVSSESNTVDINHIGFVSEISSEEEFFRPNLPSPADW